MIALTRCLSLKHPTFHYILLFFINDSKLANFKPKIIKSFVLLQNQLSLPLFQKTIIMKDFTLSATDWETLKLKLLRKYNHLSKEDLAYQPGEEQILVSRLAKRVNRAESYILFTLKKGLADLTSNRL